MFLFWVRKFKNEISINKLYSEVLKNDKLSESELSNDKFKYPTNDKNSDPGLI